MWQMMILMAHLRGLDAAWVKANKIVLTYGVCEIAVRRTGHGHFLTNL